MCAFERSKKEKDFSLKEKAFITMCTFEQNEKRMKFKISKISKKQGRKMTNEKEQNT